MKVVQTEALDFKVLLLFGWALFTLEQIREKLHMGSVVAGLFILPQFIYIASGRFPPKGCWDLCHRIIATSRVCLIELTKKVGSQLNNLCFDELHEKRRHLLFIIKSYFFIYLIIIILSIISC
jgi:hypothetical protein